MQGTWWNRSVDFSERAFRRLHSREAKKARHRPDVGAGGLSFQGWLDSRSEMLSRLARFLFGAGQDTTSHLISMAIRILGEDSDLQQRLRQEPGRIADFLEEVLRYDGPVKMAYRLALHSTAVGGVEVPAGTIVALSLAGASNDPRHFEKPGEFDIDRKRLRDHLASARVHTAASERRSLGWRPESPSREF